jgi:hypothetical protein
MLGHVWISFPLAKFVVKTLLLHEMLALFVLAILNDATQNRGNPVCVMLSKEAKVNRGGVNVS